MVWWRVRSEVEDVGKNRRGRRENEGSGEERCGRREELTFRGDF